MATSPKAAGRTLYLDTSSAQSALDKVTKKIAVLDAEIAKSNAEGKKSTKAIKDLTAAQMERAKIEQQIASKSGPTWAQQTRYVQTLRNEIKHLATGTQEFNDKLNQLTSAQKVLGSIETRIRAVGTAQASTTTGLTKMGAFFANFAANIATRAISAISDFGSSIITAGAEFEKFEAILTNALGSSSQAQSALSMLQEFAATTPFQLDQVTGAYIKLVNRGFKPTQDEMRKLGDIAASQGKDFDQLTEAILDAQTGEFERLKEFGIRASKANGMVTLSFKNQTIAVQENDEAIRNAILGFGELEGVAGGMAKVSETTAGKISNLKDRFSQLAVVIFDTFKPAIDFVIDSLGKVADVAAGAISGLADMGSMVGDVFSGNNPFVGNQIRARQRGAKAAFDGNVKGNIGDFAQLPFEKQRERLLAERQSLNRDLQMLEEAQLANDQKKVEQYREIVRRDDAIIAEMENIVKAGPPAASATAPGPKTKTKAKPGEKKKTAAQEAKDAEKAAEAAYVKFRQLTNTAINLGQVLAAARREFEGINPDAGPGLSGKGPNADAAERMEAERRVQIEIMQLQANTAKKRRDAALAAIDYETQQRIAAATGEQAELEQIYIEGLQKRKEANDAYTQEILTGVSQGLEFIQQGLSILSDFAAARTAIENAALQRELTYNNKRRESLENLRKKGLITEGAYRKQIATLDAADEKRSADVQKRQAERQRKISIAQTIVNGAQAVVRTFATYGWPLGLPFAALQAAATAAQVAVISKQKFAKGGRLSGPRHATQYGSSGIAMVRRDTGQEVGEAEGGEVILSRATVANNAPVVNQLLHSSMRNNGARIRPFWENRPYSGINYERLTSRRRFADGGLVPADNGGSTTSMGPDVTIALQRLTDRLDQGIESYIRYKTITDADMQVQRIRAAASLR